MGSAILAAIEAAHDAPHGAAYNSPVASAYFTANEETVDSSNAAACQ